jgi:hypothetical protein
MELDFDKFEFVGREAQGTRFLGSQVGNSLRKDGSGGASALPI